MSFNRPPLIKLNTRKLTTLDCVNPLTCLLLLRYHIKKWFFMTPCLHLQEKALFKQERLVLDFAD